MIKTVNYTETQYNLKQKWRKGKSKGRRGGNKWHLHKL